MIFLTETKCKIRFIYVRFNCKKSGVKNGWEFVPLRGGGGGGADAILNCHVFLNPSLSLKLRPNNSKGVAGLWTSSCDAVTKHPAMLSSSPPFQHYSFTEWYLFTNPAVFLKLFKTPLPPPPPFLLRFEHLVYFFSTDWEALSTALWLDNIRHRYEETMSQIA